MGSGGAEAASVIVTGLPATVNVAVRNVDVSLLATV